MRLALDQDNYLNLYNKFTASQTLNSEIKHWLKNNHDISDAKASSIVGNPAIHNFSDPMSLRNLSTPLLQEDQHTCLK